VSLSAAEEERQVSYQVLRKGFPARAEELPIQYAALNARGVRNDELSIVRSDGRTIEMLANAEPLFDDQGKVRGSIASYIDITERKQAEAEQARLASFPERNPNPIAEIDYFGTIFYLNPKSLALFPDLASSGLKHPLLVGLESFIQKFKAGDLEMIFTREVKAGEAYYHQTIVNIPESKHIRLYSVNITERKQVEETLARQAEDLRRSNTELEQFAYVASHDLQEPLRIMSNFSQLLERRYKGRLDQDADEFIGFIVDAASRMQKLITDLLAYSRVGHDNTNMVEVDCDRLVRNLVESMAVTIETADGQVTFDRLPIIKAHETSLIQLFQNLIGNAIKFRGEQPPRIHISARQADGEWFFSVRDNGIGIEPQYNQRIFMIFQRLHSREKYAGTGIGLSICKKIVENLGGRIWVESELGQGTTFTFTVPIRKEQHLPQDNTLHHRYKRNEK
jgi:signal transduction histidine kinase